MRTKSMKISLLYLIVSFFSSSLSVGKDLTDDIHRKIEKMSHSIFNSLVEIRRDLHQHPELSGQEVQTAKKIEERLKKIGLEVKSNIGGHGVVGILKGKRQGPVIGWRADMDAFYDTSPDPVEFASTSEGVRHICGHDVHTTIGMGLAETLKSVEHDIYGTIMFIFQPAEETATGAKLMLEDEIFSQSRFQAIFALHLGPIDAGLITVKPYEMFSRSKDLTIELSGKGDLNQAAEFCKNLIKDTHTIADSINLHDPSILLHPQFGLGNPNSVFAQYLGVGQIEIKNKTPDGMMITAHLAGSNEEMCQNALEEIKVGILNSRWKDNLKSISFSFEHFTVFNDPTLTERAVNIIVSNFGNETIVPLYGVSPFHNDDFAYFQEKIPGVYFIFGASNFTNGIFSFPHFPNFNVDEICIRMGVQIFSTLLYDYLRNNSSI